MFIILFTVALGTDRAALDIPETICANRVVAVEKNYRRFVGNHTCIMLNDVCWLCGLGESETYADIVDFRLSLTDGIELTYFLDISDDLAEDDSAEMRFTVNGKETVIPISGAKTETVSDKTLYCFTCPVSAAEMADEISAQMISDEFTGEIHSYSLMAYSEYMLEHSNEYENYIPIVKAMLNYGAQAQLIQHCNSGRSGANTACGNCTAFSNADCRKTSAHTKRCRRKSFAAPFHRLLKSPPL